MWTSRATSPRASRLSKCTGSPAAIVLGAALVAILVLLPGVECVQAQDTAAAILVRGPRPGRGIPFFGANTIEYQRGVYRRNAVEVTVYYGEQDLPLAGGLKTLQCGPHELQVLPATGEHQRVLQHELEIGGWLLLKLRPGTVEECAFAEAFIEQFEFFREAQPPGWVEAPFPAIVPFE